MVQDIVSRYNRKDAPPSALFKIDIQKAYDSVKWDFVFEMLQFLNFPPQFRNWIKECVSSPEFTINVNGESHGFLLGQSGLRQGNPLSLLLFVICMEYLTR